MRFSIAALVLLDLVSLGVAIDSPVFACNNQQAMCCQQAGVKNPKTCEYAAGGIAGQYSCTLDALPPNAYCCETVKYNKKKGSFRGSGCSEATLIL